MANGTKVFAVAALMALVAISASQGQAHNDGSAFETIDEAVSN